MDTSPASSDSTDRSDKKRLFAERQDAACYASRMASEYQALVAKVESFTRPTAARRQTDMACRAGCSACCEAWLSVGPVEAAEIEAGLAALAPEKRREVAQRGERELARERSGEAAARCAMLEPDGTCVIYEQRPLVCRTQGHALRYPPGFIPIEAVRAKVGAGEVTYCPLNFAQRPPQPEDVLDAERVDQILAVVSHRFAAAHGIDSSGRFALSELAAGLDMLKDDRARNAR